MRVALSGLAFAAAVRVIDGVHHYAAHRRTNATPADRAGLAVAAQVVLVVADFADGGAALDVHLARLGRAQANRRVRPFACGELCGAAGAARELAALAGLQLDVVNRRTDRNVAQLHAVAGLDRRFRTREHRVAGGDALRREDVATLAVLVQHEREMRGAVRIVFDALDLAGHAVLVAQEVHQAVLLLVTAALVAHGLPAEVIARAGRVLVNQQRLLRFTLVQVVAGDLDLEAAPRRSRSSFDQCHEPIPRKLGLTPRYRSGTRSSVPARDARTPS